MAADPRSGRASAPKAPRLDGKGKRSEDVSLDAAVFGVDVKPHLVHETVRAEFAASRAGTKAVKSRGLVAGGRAKPFRQKGTGRARAGTTRAVQWTGGGVAFAPRTNFEVKVNRKERRAAFRAALSDHAQAGTLAVLGPALAEPSTGEAARLLEAWGQERPVLVVAAAEEETVIKSFRNLENVLVTLPSELEVSELVWARSLLVTEAALPVVQQRAQAR